MKLFLENLGILVILAGVGALIYKRIQDIQTNELLVFSLAFIIFGLILHIIINKKISD